ncbi:MAG TPA: hypothetical protein VGD80_27035 [Kofleriaceae bacterium]
MTRRMGTISIAVFAACALTAPRRADADDGVATDHQFADRPSLHLNFGADSVARGRVASTALRMHAGVSMAFGDGRARPMIALGGTVAEGKLSIDDPRALTGSLAFSFVDYGPEAQIGIRLVDGGYADTRFFLAAAYLRTDIDHRLTIDSVHGVVATPSGFRLSIGGNWMDRLWSYIERNGDVRRNPYSLLLVLVPHQVEIDLERSFGSVRYGATMSYGL